ncbi:MAG: LysM peptidoglycan-binding domain-containing protein [Halofilum sp. (in: g-proteobacteria)]
MKMAVLYKHLGVAALALGMAVGCATTQQPEAAEESEACPEDLIAEVDEALGTAESRNREAREMGAEWREAQNMIREAEAARDECDIGTALGIAHEATAVADEAIADHRSQQAQTEPMDSEPEDRSYTVSRGDTLWGISASSVGYEDPYQWPLIYRENSGQIDDPDLIFPGQDLTIEADPSSADVEAAVEHAKTRGSWAVGEMEESDQEYLNAN